MKNPLKPRKTATQKRSQDTVEAILESATRILVKEEAATLSTNRIAEQAGVSIGSLYQYFPGKEAIMNAVIERYLTSKLKAIDRSLEELVGSAKSNEEIIEAFIEVLIDLKLKNLKLERALTFYFTRAGDVEMMKKLDNQIIQKLSMTVEPLKKKIPSFDPDWTVFILYYTLRGIILSTSTNRPHEVKSPKLKKEMVKLVSGYLLGPSA